MICLKNKIIKTNKNYSYNILKNDISFLKYEYEDLQTSSIGKSTLDKEIYYLKLGNGKNN